MNDLAISILLGKGYPPEYIAMYGQCPMQQVNRVVIALVLSQVFPTRKSYAAQLEALSAWEFRDASNDIFRALEHCKAPEPQA